MTRCDEKLMGPEPTPVVDQPDLSIVVPAFDEAERLPETISTLLGFLGERAGRSELVVVDDGSSDATAALAADLLGGRADCSLVTLGSHRGKGAAVRAGILAASGARIVFMDADLATDLEDLDRVLASLDDADVVLGSQTRPGRAGRRADQHRPRLPHRGFAGLARAVTGVPVADFQCGFKAFPRPAAKVLFEQVREPGFAFDVEVLDGRAPNGTADRRGPGALAGDGWQPHPSRQGFGDHAGVTREDPVAGRVRPAFAGGLGGNPRMIHVPGGGQ